MNIDIVKEGLGMSACDVDHQKVSVIIFHNFVRKFCGVHLFYEVCILDNPERVPDLSVWKTIDGRFNEDTSNLLLTIEITRTSQNDSYSEKSIRDTLKRIPTLNECFMYNFRKDRWVRFSRCDGEIKKEEAVWSRVLKCRMSSLLKGLKL